MKLFDPTPAAMASLAAAVDEIPAIQARLVERDPKLKHGDRVAHQQQIAGGLAKLTVAAQLQKVLEGVGLFIAGATYTGIGRISNGLGTPTLKPIPIFSGSCSRFVLAGGESISSASTTPPRQPTPSSSSSPYLRLPPMPRAPPCLSAQLGDLDLGNLAAAQKKMFDALHERLGLKLATSIYAHVAKQTARTALSTSAYQQYWTGIVQVGDTLGKFTLLPAEDVNRHRALVPAARHLTQDWRERSPHLRFALNWIPFLDDAVTPLEDLTTPWKEDHRVEVGVITFPRTRAETRQAKLLAILAAGDGREPRELGCRERLRRQGDRYAGYSVHRGALPRLPNKPSGPSSAARIEL